MFNYLVDGGGYFPSKKPPASAGGFQFNLGNVLLSHTLARAVPSGLGGLTSVFGMGTGGSLSLQSPKTLLAVIDVHSRPLTSQ